MFTGEEPGHDPDRRRICSRRRTPAMGTKYDSLALDFTCDIFVLPTYKYRSHRQHSTSSTTPYLLGGQLGAQSGDVPLQTLRGLAHVVLL